MAITSSHKSQFRQSSKRPISAIHLENKPLSQPEISIVLPTNSLTKGYDILSFFRHFVRIVSNPYATRVYTPFKPIFPNFDDKTSYPFVFRSTTPPLLLPKKYKALNPRHA